ncbi:MAG: tripartite tricarboxylate transporter TctB family protein [Synergistaceae bacterium]|nr:tripartite tricarboxylate transporter TctB family protein [Synergistaceae bacterium]
MKKTDIGVCLAMYGVCAFFLYMTLQLPKAAQIYPSCVIALLAGLTTLHVVNMIRGAIREGVTSGLEDFKDFLPSQFFVLLAVIIIYLLIMPYIGFFPASILMMTVQLLFLRVKLWQIVLAEIAIFVLVYCAFTLFLEVRLPEGTLWEVWE